MTTTPETDRRPLAFGLDCPTVAFRVPDAALAAVVAPLCLCGHQRGAHPGGRCTCCDGECRSWRPAQGRRHAFVQAVAHELRAIAAGEVPTIVAVRRARACTGSAGRHRAR